MKALGQTTDSSNNRAAFKQAGLMINPPVSPAVGLIEFRQLIEMIDASMLPDMPGLMEVLNHSWPRNFHQQLPFPDSGMQSISRINKGDIPSFRERYGLTISCAQGYVQSVRNDSREKRANLFLSNCPRQRMIGSVTRFVWHRQLALT